MPAPRPDPAALEPPHDGTAGLRPGASAVALRRRLAPELSLEIPPSSGGAAGLDFAHGRRSWGELRWHQLELGPCRLNLASDGQPCLVVVLSGEGALRPGGGKPIPLGAGSGSGAVLLPPGSFQLRSRGLAALLLCLPTERLLASALALAEPARGDGPGERALRGRLTQRLARPRPWSDREPPQRELLALLRQILRLVQTGASMPGAGFPPAGWRGEEAILQTLTMLLLEPGGDPGPSRGAAADPGHRLDGLIAHIEANLQRPLGLEELAERCGCSPRSLQYDFQRRFGCGPMQWVRRRRLEAARQALEQADPDEPVQAIAWRCGYTNLSSFSRDILQSFGSSPSRLRRRAQPEALSRDRRRSPRRSPRTD